MLCCVLMRFCKVVSSKMMLFDRWLLIVVLVWKVLRRIEVGIISTIMVMEDIIFMCIVLLTWLELKKWRFPPSLNIRSLTLAELPDTRHALLFESSRVESKIEQVEVKIWFHLHLLSVSSTKKITITILKIEFEFLKKKDLNLKLDCTILISLSSAR